MLKIILNRLKLQAEKMIAEEQAGFRAGLSTTEQIFNLRRILCEKYHQHQQDFYCVFIGSKKALGFTYSFLGNHEEAQHKCQPFLSHRMPLWQGHQCSPLQQWHRRLVLNNTWNLTGMSAFIFTHPVQRIFRKDHDRHHRTKKITKALSALEAEHSVSLVSALLITLMASRRGGRTGKISWASW